MSAPFQMPRVLAWEVTRRCPLACKHCRAGAANVRYEHELTTDECRRVIDSLDRTMIIWTGGEPMLRPDILDLLRHKKEHVKGRCRTCRWLDLCGGNFRARGEAVTGDIWGEDPTCYLTESEISS